MAKATITVGSITYALKAKKALERLGIRAGVVKSRSQTGGKGCSYGIEYPIHHEMTVVSELRRLGISFEYRR